MTLMTSDQGGGFDELASGSLPSLGGNPLQPSWSRSLQELIASNQALLGGNPQQPTAAAQVLLGDRTDFSTLAASTPKQPKPTEVFCSMQERCRKYRDGTIERILQRERDQTQKTQQKALEQQQEDDWARESEWWRKEIVGTRNLVDSANGLSTRPPEQQLMLVGSNLQGLSVSPHNFLGDPRSSRATPLDAKMANDHLQVVKSITPSSNSSRQQQQQQQQQLSPDHLQVSKNLHFGFQSGVYHCMAASFHSYPESDYSHQRSTRLVDSFLSTVSNGCQEPSRFRKVGWAGCLDNAILWSGYGWNDRCLRQTRVWQYGIHLAYSIYL